MIRASGARGPGFNSRPSPSNPFVKKKERDKNHLVGTKMIKRAWSCRGLNPRPSKCESDALPLSYNPQYKNRRFQKEYLIYFSFFSKLQVNKIEDSSKGFRLFFSLSNFKASFLIWLCGATVARPTPDRKAACSNHVRVKCNFFSFTFSSLTQPKLEVRRIKFR